MAVGEETTVQRARRVGSAKQMGATLRELRQRAGLSQREVADRAGMHHNQYGAIERGGTPNPTLHTIVRLARSLEISAGVLAAAFARRPHTQLTLLTDTERQLGIVGPTRRNHARAQGSAIALGNAIRGLRRDLDLTQEELAGAAGLHAGHFGRIERGEDENPGLRTIAQIAAPLAQDDDPGRLIVRLVQIFSGELDPAERKPDIGPIASGPADPLSPSGSGH